MIDNEELEINEEEDCEDSELSFLLEKGINSLAALLYQSNGRTYSPEIDFRNSSHGEEISCWNHAVIAYAVINGDNWFLQFQV